MNRSLLTINHEPVAGHDQWLDSLWLKIICKHGVGKVGFVYFLLLMLLYTSNH